MRLPARHGGLIGPTISDPTKAISCIVHHLRQACCAYSRLHCTSAACTLSSTDSTSLAPRSCVLFGLAHHATCSLVRLPPSLSTLSVLSTACPHHLSSFAMPPPPSSLASGITLSVVGLWCKAFLALTTRGYKVHGTEHLLKALENKPEMIAAAAAATREGKGKDVSVPGHLGSLPRRGIITGTFERVSPAGNNHCDTHLQ